MKKLVSYVILVAILLSVFTIGCFAEEMKENITYLENGSYIIDTIVLFKGRASGSISGSRTKSYYDANGNLDWKAVLNGSFTYTGSSATCTSSSVSVTVYDSAWYTIFKTASKSGNTASASVTMGCKELGITVDRVTIPISLTCDKDGNLS